MEGSALGKHKFFLFSFVTPTFGCFFSSLIFLRTQLYKFATSLPFYFPSNSYTFAPVLLPLLPFSWSCLCLKCSGKWKRDCCFPVPSQLLSLINRFLNLILVHFSPLHANGPWSYLSVQHLMWLTIDKLRVKNEDHDYSTPLVSTTFGHTKTYIKEALLIL